MKVASTNPVRSPRSIRTLLHSLGLTAGLGVSSCGGTVSAGATAGSTAGSDHDAALSNPVYGSGSSGASGTVPLGNAGVPGCIDLVCPADSLGPVTEFPFDGGPDLCLEDVPLGNCATLTCIVPCPPDAALGGDAALDADAQDQADAQGQRDAQEEGDAREEPDDARAGLDDADASESE